MAPVDTHRWIWLVPFRLTASEVERARGEGGLTLDIAHVDWSLLPVPGCYECECACTSAQARQPCPGAVRGPEPEAAPPQTEPRPDVH